MPAVVVDEVREGERVEVRDVVAGERRSRRLPGCSRRRSSGAWSAAAAAARTMATQKPNAQPWAAGACAASPRRLSSSCRPVVCAEVTRAQHAASAPSARGRPPPRAGAPGRIVADVLPPVADRVRRAGAGEAARVRQVPARRRSATTPAATSRPPSPSTPSTAALACPLVDRVLVVTDDHELARGLRRPRRRRDPRRHDRRPQRHAACRPPPRCTGATRTCGLVALCADLPALRPEELAAALAAAPPGPVAFVADADGVGTTAVVARRRSTRSAPAFGPRVARSGTSTRARTRSTRSTYPTLRRDVDTAPTSRRRCGSASARAPRWSTTTLRLCSRR